MINTVARLLVAVLVNVAFFGAVIYFSLRFRRSSMKDSLDIRAAGLWEPFTGDGFAFESLTYGVTQDFSAFEIGMIVRDCRDEQIGRVAIRTGARAPWVTIESDGALYEVDALPSFAARRCILHPAGDAGKVLCTFSASFWGTFRFDVNGFGVIESRPVARLRITPRFELTLDGRKIGVSQHIGGLVNRGRLLILQADLAPPVRSFILAMQATRT